MSQGLNCKPSLEKVKVLEVREEEDKVFIKVCKDERFGVCPSCGSVSTKIHEKRSSHCLDKPEDGNLIFLEVEKRRFECKNEDCNTFVFTEEIEGLKKRTRFTDAFKDFIYELSKEKGYLDAHNFLKKEFNIEIGLATVFYNKLDKYIEGRDGKEQVLCSLLNVERIKFDDFLTVLVDLNNKKPLFYFKGALSDERKRDIKRVIKEPSNVKIVFIEPYKPYKKFFKDIFIDSSLILDKYHIFKNFNESSFAHKRRILEFLTKEIDLDAPVKRFLKFLILKRIDLDTEFIKDINLLKDTRIELNKPLKNFFDYLMEAKIDIDKPAKEFIKKLSTKRIDTLFYNFKDAYLEVLRTFKLKQNLREIYKKTDISLIEKNLSLWFEDLNNSKVKEFVNLSKCLSPFKEEVLNYFKIPSPYYLKI